MTDRPDDAVLLKALAEFDEGNGGWKTEGTGELLDLGLLDYEESYDGSVFWLTSKGREALERGAL